VLRGSSWLDTNPVNQRLAMRRLLPPPHAFEDSGFRCARSVDAWKEE
jgi:formylglycine-generating enzyme required for sulfatase activity